jgi:hypothetical protein
VTELLAPLITLWSFAANQDEVAIVARIYNKPSEHRASHYEIYLCGLHGEHRRAVAQPTDPYPRLWWADHRHLRWADSISQFGLAADKLHVASEYDTVSGRVRTVQIRGAEFADKTLQLFIRPPATIHSTERALDSTFAIGEDIASGTLSRGGQSQKIKIDGSDQGALLGVHFDSQSNSIWICTELGFSTWGPTYDIYRLNWQDASLEHEIYGHKIDFSPRRQLYAGVEHRELAKYSSRKQVWVANAFIGNWQTKKEWIVLGGMVEAISIALRP